MRRTSCSRTLIIDQSLTCLTKLLRRSSHLYQSIIKARNRLEGCHQLQRQRMTLWSRRGRTAQTNGLQSVVQKLDYLVQSLSFSQDSALDDSTLCRRELGTAPSPRRSVSTLRTGLSVEETRSPLRGSKLYRYLHLPSTRLAKSI